MNHEEFVWPFNDRGSIEDAKTEALWGFHKKAIERPETLTRTDKDEIYRRIRDSTTGGYSTGYSTGIRLMGVFYSFKPVLKRFLVHYRCGDWYERWAPDKMSIRNHSYESGITEIVELKQIEEQVITA